MLLSENYQSIFCLAIILYDALLCNMNLIIGKTGVSEDSRLWTRAKSRMSVGLTIKWPWGVGFVFWLDRSLGLMEPSTRTVERQRHRP